MTFMKLDKVSVDFPIYGGTSRSLKNSLVHVGTGGRLATDAANRKVVNALRNVDLDVREGDRLGLVGGNGAGKTTLLRVMSGIYEPTKGIYSSRGHIVPLFGGTLGMNLELPGMDNIVQRGRVLGLSAKQIQSHIDDIVAFTELEHFIHLPMRTYSAGMRVRLAFAITTAVDADILLLDEGLGAGDESFRKKAAERLAGFVSRAGILILATHSASMMRQFCDQGLLLDHGEVKMRGPIADTLRQYRDAADPERVTRRLEEKKEKKRIERAAKKEELRPRKATKRATASE
jgi:ABC-2 type transport system ATP-binding protein